MVRLCIGVEGILIGYDTAFAFRKTHVVDGNRLKYEGFEALSLSVTANKFKN